MADLKLFQNLHPKETQNGHCPQIMTYKH
jgi:hypothetical protein